MTRTITSLAIVALALFSLTACGGSPSTPAETPAADPTTSAPAAPVEQTTPAETGTTAAGQSLTEACLEPSAKLVEASAELMKVSAALAASDGQDAKALADALNGMGDYFGTVAESTSNQEVKEALTGISKYYVKLGELLPKMLVDKDMTAAAEATQAMADLQKSLEAFQTLCTP